MKLLACAFLYLNAAIFLALGLASLIAPQMVAPHLELLPSAGAGTSEFRALYGGGFIGYALLFWGALHWRSLAPGLLVALMILLGAIATARLASLPLDHAMSALGAAVGEYLIVIACWYLYRDHAA